MRQNRLKWWATVLREDIIAMLAEAGSGHPAGALGMADIFTVLYFQVLRHRSLEPNWPKRDRLILSNGHICPVLYAALAESGYFPRRELLTLRKFGSRLQGHPDRLLLPGVENTSGPLGQGFSQAVGVALAAQIDQASWHTYVILSDGEQDEGQTWEAVLYAGAHKLNNLTAIIDRNRIQIGGDTERVLPLEQLTEKYRAFNWEVRVIDGNNPAEILSTLEIKSERPVCILAQTIPGKGVSFMESDYRWHGKAPNQEEAAEALRELEEARQKV